MAAKLVVVQFRGSTETEAYIAARYREALDKKLIGIAAICMYSHNHYALAIKGEIRRAPTFTRGLLPELDDQLARIIRGL